MVEDNESSILPPDLAAKKQMMMDSETESEDDETVTEADAGANAAQYQQYPVPVEADLTDAAALQAGQLQQQPIVRDDLVNPYWAEGAALGDGPTITLDPEESQFFQVLNRCHTATLEKLDISASVS